ncbi:DUF6538 domain-containing protein [Azospirillum melinis]
MLHVQRRGDGFRWRRKVPEGLRSRFVKRELVVSLRTKDRATAIVRGRRLTAVADRLFASAMTDTALTTDRINAIARDWLAKELDAAERDLEKVRAGETLYAAPDPEIEPIQADLTLLSDLIGDSREALAVNDYRQIEVVADELLAAGGLSVDRASDAYGRFCRTLLRAQVELLNQTKARRVGDYGHPARDPLFALPPVATAVAPPVDRTPQSMALAELVEVYAEAKVRDGEWKGRTLTNTKPKLTRFAEILNNKAVDDLTRDDVRDWRDALADMELSNNTIIQNFKYVNAMLNWAKIEGKCTIDSPLKGLAPKADGADRDAYTPADLKVLFHCPLYTGHWRADRRERPGGVLVKDHKFWLPLIALHSGLRAEEAAKLKVTDLRQIEGVWCFSVEDTKTAAGTRIVPVHPRLIRLGLLSHHEHVSKKDAGPLWPEIKPSADGRYSEKFCAWWSHFRHLVGLGRSGLKFHSFRHTFISSLQVAGVPETLSGQLAGHVVNVGITYGVYGGKLLSAPERLALIERLDFGVDLSHLEPAG